MRTVADDRCGTKAGASVHDRRGEPRCDACRAADTANRAAWAAANPGRDRVTQAAYYARRPEEMRERSRAYRAANREAVNARKRAAWRRSQDAKREEESEG